jgi:phage terminase large subunit
MTNIQLPHQWEPRPYQLPVLDYFNRGGKRAVAVWARRHGKDSTAINQTACAAMKRPGLYWHVLPTLRQARKAVWNGIDKQGRRIIDQAFPLEIRAGQARDDEMMIRLANGSVWQCVGADNHDALVGSNPVGVVLSEWSLMDPKTYDFIRPILMENDGWAWFIYTPRGRNHGWELYDMARRTPGWFAEVVTIADAKVLDVDAVLAEERASGMPEELIQQEYFCSFDTGNVGTIYAKEMDRLEAEGKFTSVPYDPNFPVETGWDIGIDDPTAIWFFQRVGLEIRVIDYYENRQEGAPHYAGVIKAKNYAYARHVGPHDLANRQWGEGNSIRSQAENHGLFFEIAPKLPKIDGINASRGLLPRCVFDATRCADGIKALRNYKWIYDEDKRVFKREPDHTWASHAADAFRYYAVMPELELVMPEWVKRIMAEKRAEAQKWKPEPELVGMGGYDPLGGFR